MNISSEQIEAMQERWLPGAMYPSEMVWLYQQVVNHRIDVLIECGRQDGVSTRTLGELLAPHGIRILSIDFDEDKDRLERVKASLAGLNVECVSGDIHFHVPRLIKENKGARIAVVQDGPKGWEGLSTLVASAFIDDVVLLAQHNLHAEHRSRAYFGLLACNPPFLEFDRDAQLARDIRAQEVASDRYRISNRSVGHSSLGICSNDGAVRDAVMTNILELDHLMGPWSALKTFEAWQRDDFEHVTALRKRQRFSLYRFKIR